MWLSPLNSLVFPLKAGTARSVAVAIPARSEAALIAKCLEALDVAAGHPGADTCDVSVLVLVNNSRDATARVAREFRPRNLTAIVSEVELLPRDAHAGGARRMALDRAAALLPPDGILMTTDADSCVCPGWIAANLAEIAAGADAVAGIVAFDEAARSLLPDLPGRALEWQLASLQARIGDLIDPLAHDPWPRHIWAWGASLALTLQAYITIGGLPAIPLAEDRALAAAIERADLKLRRSYQPIVYTSSRLSGRAPGGFADLLKSYASDASAPCDAALEPTRDLVRRLRLRSDLRRSFAQRQTGPYVRGFGALWSAMEAELPDLARRRLMPGELKREVALCERIISLLQRREARRCDSPASVFAE